MVLLFLLLGVALLVKADGDVACSGTGLDWYIDMVGESPCTTYERLRQICNPSFEVGVMNVNTPPDACNEQVVVNKVLEQAAMGLTQVKAPTSSTSRVLVHPDNGAAPSRTRVCDRNIKIIDDIRTGLFWSDGSWFYVWSYEAISEDVGANNNNAFTHCASSTSTSASTSTSSSTPNAIVSSLTTSTSADPTSGNTVTVATQAPDTTNQPSPSSSSNLASSATPASGISTTSFTSISGSTIILGSTFTVIYPSSISYSGSSLVSTSASGNTSSTAPASGGTSGSSQTFLTPSSRMSQGLIGGITGAAIGAVCAVLALWFLCRSLRKRKDAVKTATYDTTLVNDEPFTLADQPTSWYTTTGSNIESSTPLISRPRKLEFEGRSDPSTQSQLISDHCDDPETDDQNNGSQERYSDVMNSNVLFPMRHTDAGPVQVTVERRMSGSLPPAYGEQIS
ncbi:hypothetical protein F5876DRAFT_64338 [Lentinula aff. lateritia]|uniref:Uncharacterized protein n=1 Tax=Lentinula aff. lateritia TaxID=2804960 RepID=A0ACC1U4I1_9AGAR|nr:hypothetical protein F5876DRAFT_64338 [Lentinula aff. lateritia]